MTQLDLVSKEVPYQHCLKKSEDEGKVLILLKLVSPLPSPLVRPSPLLKQWPVRYPSGKIAKPLIFLSTLIQIVTWVWKRILILGQPQPPPFLPQDEDLSNAIWGLTSGGGRTPKWKSWGCLLLSKLRGVICKFWSHLGYLESHNYWV